MDSGGGGVACAARLCHGRSGRDRHEPVLEPSPVPLTQAWRQTLSGMKQRAKSSRLPSRALALSKCCLRNNSALERNELALVFVFRIPIKETKPQKPQIQNHLFRNFLHALSLFLLLLLHAALMCYTFISFQSKA